MVRPTVQATAASTVPSSTVGLCADFGPPYQPDPYRTKNPPSNSGKITNGAKWVCTTAEAPPINVPNSTPKLTNTAIVARRTARVRKAGRRSSQRHCWP